MKFIKKTKLFTLLTLAAGVMIFGTACSSKSNSISSMTGVFEENRGAIFTFTNDLDNITYAFDLTDEALITGIEEGDKVTVTYKGEDPDPTDVTDTVVLEVVKVN